MAPPVTPSQTVGPFFHLGLTRENRDDLVPHGASAEALTIRGQVLDGDGECVTDALVEIWQANPEGVYAGVTNENAVSAKSNLFTGFARIPTDPNGAFRFTTVKPGRVAGPGGTLQAPHVVVTVFARGLLKHLMTRMYFPDERSNSEDTVLNLVPAERRSTLVAKHSAEGNNVLEWNIILQGQDETVFFDL